MHDIPAMYFRRYKDSDKAQVYQLHKFALEAAGVRVNNRKPDGSYIYPEWSDKDIDDIPDTYFKGGDFIVCEVGGEIVAMGALKKISEETGEIKRVRVHPDFQRKGVAQKILDMLENKAKEFGYKKLVLDTTIKQVAAQAFYQKNGYMETHRKRVEVFDTVLIFYEKNLT